MLGSPFCLNTSSNCSSCFSSSSNEIITGFAFSLSRKAYLSVNGRVFSSKVGLSNGSSSNFVSSLIIISSSMQASISWSLEKSMTPNYSEAREGYFVSLLMSTFMVSSPTLRITSLYPQSVMGHPQMIER